MRTSAAGYLPSAPEPTDGLGPRTQSDGGASVVRRSTRDGGGKVNRFSREKLMALRLAPRKDADWPEALKHLEGSVCISSEAQDPG